MTVTLNHIVEGPEDAAVLVLLNSLGTDMAMWEPQVAALREDLRLVRCDARGHGGSPTPAGSWSLADLAGDVLGLLDSLGIERASIAGVSLGGATAIWLGINAPDRVERLLPCFTSPWFGPPEPWLERAALVRAAGVEAVADAVLDRWFTKTAPADLRARMRTMMVATPAEGYASAAEVVARIDLRGDLARIGAPTLVLSGAEDPATPSSMGRAIAEGIPGGGFVEVPGAAHLGNLERPGSVTDLIRMHLRKEIGCRPPQTTTTG